jgi:hypothetical protein
VSIVACAHSETQRTIVESNGDFMWLGLSDHFCFAGGVTSDHNHRKQASGLLPAIWRVI